METSIYLVHMVRLIETRSLASLCLHFDLDEMQFYEIHIELFVRARGLLFAINIRPAYIFVAYYS